MWREGISRRGVLLGAGALLAAGRAQAAPPARLAAIDWALMETAASIDAPLVAGTELLQFGQIAVEPAIPSTVADLGLRGSPNFEFLRLLEPDLILISNFYEYQRAQFERIAPVLSLAVYETGKPPYAPSERAALALGEAVGREGEAAALVAASGREIEALRARLAPIAARPVFLISLGDRRHFRAFGPDSMFGDVAARLGLRNAWDEDTSYTAAAPVGIERLARVPEASVVVIGPVPLDARRAFRDSAIWRALPAVREGRVAVLPPVNHFGGLPAARRFVRLLGQALVPADG